jgi:hypothetical protein
MTVALLAVTLVLSACGGSGSSSNAQPTPTLSGNWQFTVANPPDGSFFGGLQGGFLLQNGGSATGSAVYAVALTSQAPPCNSGSAPITATLSGQTWTLTAVAGTQTFTFTGMLSSDGSTIAGTYNSTAGTAGDGSPCGTAQTGLQWSALLVPPLTGAVAGNFHSIGGSAGLINQDFAVTGSLTQGQNIGASNATVTGTVTFLNPLTNISDYPCFSTASVNGQISGSYVILQFIGVDGSTVAQLGEPSSLTPSTGINPIKFESVHNGYILHGAQPTYMAASTPCGGSLGNINVAGDFGNICLALNSATACTQPISLSPPALSFPAQLLGSLATTQTITLANNSGSTLNNLTLAFSNNGDSNFYAGGQSGDFTPTPSFLETDACGLNGVASNGQPFSLDSGQSCLITVSFSPQEACPWLPFGNPPTISGAAPEWCPFPQTAEVTANSPSSADNDKSFTVPINGIGLSAIVPSVNELDFGAEQQSVGGAGGEASLPQMLTFTNNSLSPLQILGSRPCTNPPTGQNVLPHPILQSSPVAGLQVVSNGSGFLGITPDDVTIAYNCDSDPLTTLPNFQISSDTCTGNMIAPQTSCSLQIAYVPQPNTNVNSGLDFFLELNTVQCSDTVTSDCEIDSGRFPVELKANTPSPLRMSPGAGVDFGIQTVGKSSGQSQITLLNDPNATNPQTITFIGKITAQGNYSETDNCPVTLAPGASCTLTVTFKPSTVGFLPGSLTINYSPEPFGEPQFVYLRGTGQ